MMKTNHRVDRMKSLNIHRNKKQMRVKMKSIRQRPIRNTLMNRNNLTQSLIIKITIHSLVRELIRNINKIKDSM